MVRRRSRSAVRLLPWAPAIAIDVKVGDEVYYGKFGGNEVKIDGEDFLLLRADDIYAVIED